MSKKLKWKLALWIHMIRHFYTAHRAVQVVLNHPLLIHQAYWILISTHWLSRGRNQTLISHFQPLIQTGICPSKGTFCILELYRPTCTVHTRVCFHVSGISDYLVAAFLSLWHLSTHSRCQSSSRSPLQLSWTYEVDLNWKSMKDSHLLSGGRWQHAQCCR